MRFSQSFLDETLADLTGQAFDAIYLSLHGAGVTTKREDPEVELLARHPENSADGADRREFRPARQSRQRAGKLSDDGQRLPHLSAHRHARDGVARAERAGADGCGRDQAGLPHSERGPAAAELQHAHEGWTDARTAGVCSRPPQGAGRAGSDRVRRLSVRQHAGHRRLRAGRDRRRCVRRRTGSRARSATN